VSAVSACPAWGNDSGGGPVAAGRGAADACKGERTAVARDALVDVDYPADKRRLLRHAQRHGADAQVRAILRGLPPIDYVSFAQAAVLLVADGDLRRLARAALLAEQD
jgi:Protein of unknown function (DUF2795)